MSTTYSNVGDDQKKDENTGAPTAQDTGTERKDENGSNGDAD